MNSILILAHGSKRPETEKIMNSLVNKVKAKIGDVLVHPAYLQLSKPSLQEGIEYLVGKGARKVKIVPMFIFDGVHVTSDIPQELNEVKIKYPDIEFVMSSHIGDDDKLADIIIDRINSIV